jgi:glycosyltransferase involved in cell wall biosynthesis
VEAGDEVSIISTYPCAQDEVPGTNIVQVSLAFGKWSAISHCGSLNGRGLPAFARLVSELRVGRIANIGQALRAHWGPLDVRRKAPLVREIIDALKPDLVHAMRLPYEGFLGAEAVRNIPLLISIWGTDLTLFAARRSKLMKLTRAAMSRADAIHCDCHRDIELAIQYGFPTSKPWRVLPGGGGVRVDSHPGVRLNGDDLLREYDIARGVPLIINPRGFRQYLRNDIFFRSIPLVLEEVPNAIFVATGMQGNPIAERWTRKLAITHSVRLLPTVSQRELATLFKYCAVSVSPSLHDGTPNTLLEAMAAGCFPVAGDLQSVREWIQHGENGLLCDASNARSVAVAIVRASKDGALRERAALLNGQLISVRADYATSMKTAREFYLEIIRRKRSSLVATAETRGSQCAASLVS